MKRLVVTLIVLNCLVLVSGGGLVAAGPQEAATARSEAAFQFPCASFQQASGKEILFQDDFEDGNLSGWKATTTWLVQKRIGNSVLVATGSGQAAWVPDGLHWTDYYVRAGIRLEAGGVGLAFRVSTEGRYWLYYSEKSLALLKEQPKGNFTLLKQTVAPRLKTGQALAIGGFGGHLQVYLGEALQMDYVDPAPLTRGTIGIGVAHDGNAVIDNVIVTLLPRDLPAPSASQPLPPTLQASAQPAAGEGEWEDLGGWMPEEEAAPPVEGGAPSEGEWVVEEEVSEEPVEGVVEEGGWSSEEVIAEEPAGGGEQPAGLPVIDYFYAEPVESEPGCFYLHWDLHDAESAYLNGQGITAPNSSQVCEPGAYTLHAQNAVGSVEQIVTISAGGEIIAEEPPVSPEEGLSPGEGGGGLPDLVVQESTVQVPDPGQPNVVRGYIVVVNMGNAFSPAYTLRWFPHRNSDVVGYSEDGGPLEPGRSREFIFSYTYPERGDMHWGATVDPDGEIAESDETNNEGAGVVQIERR